MHDDERTAVCAAIRKVTGKEPLLRWNGSDWTALTGFERGDLHAEGGTIDIALVNLLTWASPKVGAGLNQ